MDADACVGCGAPLSAGAGRAARGGLCAACSAAHTLDGASEASSAAATPGPATPFRATDGAAARGVATVGPAPEPPPAPDLAGTTLGAYRLEAEIGRGGMGAVYRAVDTRLGRTVALKVLSGADLPTEAIERFRREAEAAGKLRHEHIVTLYEVGCDAGRHFLALEFVDGENLAQRLRTAPPRLEEGIDLFLPVVDAIEHAHRHGVVHRDLKPHNVLLDRDGRAVVADFGLAKDLAGGSPLTRTGVVLGTPMYMAPEQADSAGAADARTDVYGLGATLYELLTGRPPFSGESTAQVLAAVLFRDPIPPARINRKVPSDLETICLKALEKEPDRRYASARALAEDLRRWQRGEPIEARPVGAGGRLFRKARRHRGALAAAGAILLVAGASAAWFADRMQVAEREVREREREAKRVEEKLRVEGEALAARARVRERTERALGAAESEPAERALELVAAALADDPDSVELRVRRARLLADLGRSTEAVAELDAALARDPGNAAILYRRAMQHAWALGDRTKAADDFAAILKSSPDHALAREGQACLALFAGRTDEAEAGFAASIARDPDRAEPYYFRGMGRVLAGRWSDAAADFTAALDRKPEDRALILVERSRAWATLKEPARALADAEQALVLRPGFARAWVRKAMALDALERNDEAVAAAEKGIALAPEVAEHRVRLAEIHRSRNDLAACFAAATKAVELDPRCAAGWESLADVRFHRGELPEAIADCDRALAADAESIDAHSIKAAALLGQERWEEAARSATRAIELGPNSPNAYVVRAKAYRALGDGAKAAADLQRHIDLLSSRAVESAPLHRVLAQALELAGRYDEAIGHLTQVIDAEPQAADAILTRANLYLKTDRDDRALADAEAYVKLRPDDLDAFRLQALAHFKHGRTDAAMAAVEEAFRRHPRGRADLWSFLAHGRNLRGETAAALAAIERGLALEPAHTELLYNQACLLAKSGAPERAREALAKAVEHGFDSFADLWADPDLEGLRADAAFGTGLAEAALRRSEALLESGFAAGGFAPGQARAQFEKALRVLDGALSLGERIASRSARARLLWTRSVARAQLRRRAEQIADLETAAALEPGYESRLHQACGERALDEGRFDEAIASFGEALAREPGLAEVFCLRGRARLALGDLAGARADLAAGFERRPALRPYYEADWLEAGGGK